MSFEIPAEFAHDVERYAEDAQITPDEAVRRIVADGLRPQSVGAKKGPRPPLREADPEHTIGLFADVPDFIETMERVIASREARYSKSR